jgi:uncharacterized protein DUF4276
MPTIGLIVEGEYDEAAIPVFVKRCRNGINVITRKCRGSVAGRVAGILTELDRASRIEKVLVISDADGQSPTRIVSAITDRIAGAYRFVVTPLVIVEMLEAWIIADRAALSSVLGTGRSFPHPERIADPKSELRRLFSRASAYTPEFARRIAERIDLNVLGQRCPRFTTFREAIGGAARATQRSPRTKKK